MERRGGVNLGGPSKAVEALVAILLPPARREEVLGDLQERFKSPSQYLADALQTIPLVIFSQMRRVTDTQLLLMEGFAFYISFLGAALLRESTIPRAQWGLVRLAIPAAIAIMGSVLSDVYAHPGSRWGFRFSRGPLVGIILALASEEVLRIDVPAWSVPRWTLFYGSAIGLVSASAVRSLFPPLTPQLSGRNTPVLRLKEAHGRSRTAERINGVLKWLAGSLALILAVTWMGKYLGPPRAMVLLLAVVFCAYQVGRRF